jgi:putative membrane protein
VKLINSIIAVIVALLVILFAVSNLEHVAVRLWPFPYQLDLALYAVILLAVLLGFIAGIIGAWLAGGRRRREVRRLRRQVRDLEESLARHHMTTTTPPSV